MTEYKLKQVIFDTEFNTSFGILLKIQFVETEK